MTSQTIGISWNRTASEATAYSWLENLAQFNSGGYCPQGYGNVNQANVTAYLNSVLPFAGMRRCNILSNGIITAWQNASLTGCGYTDTPSTPTTQAGWTLPAYYYYTNHTPGVDNTYRWYISATGAATDTVNGSAVTWKLHPAFSRGGVPKPYIVLGAYEGYVNGGYLNSTAGVIPTTNQTITTFRGYANAVGAGWNLQDYLSTCAVQLPLLMEMGGFNSQLFVGAGITNITAESHRVEGCRTGWTSTLAAANGGTNLGNTTGNGVTFTTSTADGLVSPDTATSGNSAVSYRGLENFWGNIGTLYDGINILATSGAVWVADNGFAVDTFSPPYNDTGVVALVSSVNYCTSDILASASFDYGFLASAVSGTNFGIKLCDIYTSGSSGVDRIPAGAGYWPQGAYAGPWMINLIGTAASYTSCGARLMYIPQ